jgi:hypothetical protein
MDEGEAMFRRRRRPEREIAFSFDSFLDLVANVVGIIIRLILVAWVGARTYTGLVHLPAHREPEAPPATSGPALTTEREQAALDAVRRRLAGAQADLLAHLREQEQLRGRQADVARRLAALAEERRRLDEEAESLGARGRQEEQERARTGLSLEEVRRRAGRLARELEAVRRLPSLKKTLTYRTPVAQVLQSEELQFECQRGRVTFVDVEALLREVQQGLRVKGEQLKTRWELEDDTPSCGAFRLHYAIARQRGLLDSVVGTSAPDARADFSYGLAGWVAVPVVRDRGEPEGKALAPGSEFRRIIDGLDPKQTAVTFWVYPDSFALYRRLRDYCLGRDIVVAGRPLPDGVPIASSRHGTASLGQ